LVEPSSWFSLWLDQRFQVNPVGSKLGQRLRPYLPGNVFAKGFVWLKGVFGKHPRKPILTILVLGKNAFFPNIALKKRFLLIAYDLILTKNYI
jgi:hypothetical protein